MIVKQQGDANCYLPTGRSAVSRCDRETGGKAVLPEIQKIDIIEYSLFHKDAPR